MRATVYGLSTEGYKVASALASNGVHTTIIDENLHMGLELNTEMVKRYPTIEDIVEDEVLLGVQPADEAITKAKYIFFTPKLRKLGEDLRGELAGRLRDVGRRLPKGAVILYNAPTRLGGSSENIEVLSRMSGLSLNEGFSYVYAPFEPRKPTPTVIGSSKPKLDKESMEILSLAGIRATSLVSIEAAELLHFKHVLEKYCGFMAGLEIYRKIKSPTEKAYFKKARGYKNFYLDDVVEGLVDLKLLSSSLATGEPLLHWVNGLLKSCEGYTRYLVDEIREVMRLKEMKPSKTRIALYWSLDRMEMRGDRLMVLDSILERLRDYVGEVATIGVKRGEAPSERRLSSLLLEGRALFVVVCSEQDYQMASKEITVSRITELSMMKANLLCEVIR